MYILDWYDKNQCHHNNPDGHDQGNGRIFKLIYNNQKVTAIDLQKKSDDELVQLQLHKNDFYVRHARRILQERGPNPAVHRKLKEILAGNQEETRNLRALWALHATDGLDEAFGATLLGHKDEYMRAWTIQCLAEGKKVGNGTLKKLAELAEKDPSPVVRLYLASAMQRIEPSQRWEVVTRLAAHAEDANDHNLPLMYWYAIEPSVGADPQRGVQLLTQCKIPKVRQFIARRLTSTSKALVQN